MRLSQQEPEERVSVGNGAADACGSYGPRGFGTRLFPLILQRPVANRTIESMAFPHRCRSSSTWVE
jgi:hypothetical protein